MSKGGQLNAGKIEAQLTGESMEGGFVTYDKFITNEMDWGAGECLHK